MNFLSCTIWLVGVGGAECDHLVAQFSQRGFKVQVFPDGKAAFGAFDGSLPDMLVVAASLSDMSASQLCQRLRLNSVTRGIPVVVLTQAADVVVEHEVLGRGLMRASP